MEQYFYKLWKAWKAFLVIWRISLTNMDHPKWHVILFWSTFNIFSSCVYVSQEYQKRFNIADSLFMTHFGTVTVSWKFVPAETSVGQDQFCLNLKLFEWPWIALYQNLFRNIRKQGCPLELWTPFNYFVTLSNSKSVTKSSQYVTWSLNWYYIIIWPKYRIQNVKHVTYVTFCWT